MKHRKATPAEEAAGRSKCWRSGDEVVHVAACRPARPLCKWMRAAGQPEKYGVCTCGMYWFPHRVGSCRCRIGIPWDLPIPDEMKEEECPF